MKSARIMLIDNEEALCRMMTAVLSDQGYKVTAFTRPSVAVKSYIAGNWDLVVSDVKMPEMDGLEVLQQIRAKDPEVPIIMITAFATVEMSIQALRKGACDMLTKPFEPDELVFRIGNALQHSRLLEENRELREELAGKFRFENIVGNSPALHQVLTMVEKVAVRDTAVLITGESGTGKELIAQAIHFNSPRRDRRFMAINCGALPESLLESELFGYRKGAFTDAREDRVGLLEAADGGTLFLDEVGTLPMAMQKSLLRCLQEQEFMRLGDTQPTKVNVRIISATNADLQQSVRQESFREDLYYRLNVVNLRLPPLRDRQDDIPLLISHFIQTQKAKFDSQVRGFSPVALEAAREYPWPGNIRQLQNVVEACMTMASDELIDLETLGQFIQIPGGPDDVNEQTEHDYNEALGRFETRYLRNLLRATGGNVEEAARQAGMNMATIYRKLKKYQLRRDDIL